MKYDVVCDPGNKWHLIERKRTEYNNALCSKIPTYSTWWYRWASEKVKFMPPGTYCKRCVKKMEMIEKATGERPNETNITQEEGFVEIQKKKLTGEEL